MKKKEKSIKIKIKDYTYTIKFVSCQDPDMSITLDNGIKTEALGLTMFKHQIIKIQDCLTEERTYNTIVHEITHAYLDVYLTDSNLKGNLDDESICCFMASYGIDIINTANKVFCHFME